MTIPDLPSNPASDDAASAATNTPPTLYVGHAAMVRSGLVAALVFVCDQLSKMWVLNHFDVERRCPVGSAASIFCDEPLLPFFNLTMVWNTGVSMGMFQAGTDAGRWGLAIITILIAVTIAWWLTREKNTFQRFAFSLVLGGALGNIIDRLRLGAVADFIHFTPDLPLIGQFWVFNLADAAISIGVILLLVHGFFQGQDPPPPRSVVDGHNLES